MDYMKGSSGESLPMQQQQQQAQQQQQKLKKKSKNKKKSSRAEAATTTGTATTAALSTVTVKDVDVNADSCDVQEGSGLAINGLSDQLKQQLHLGESREVSSNSNASKVNGLVTEKHVNTNACPNKTNTTASLEKSSEKLHKPSPALNGHHAEEESKPSDHNEVSQASIKKTKRKPNNKKNPPTTDNLAATKENGHCPSKQNSANSASEAVKEHLHNGFSHENKEENIQQQLTPATIKRETFSQLNDNKTAMTPATTLAKEQNTPKKQDKEDSNNSQEGVELISIENPLVDLDLSNVHIEYKEYESELQMHDIMRLIQAELSEPYSIYTYRYFIYNWPKLCFLAAHGNEYVGAIVCKLGMHMNVRRGYIAMLAVRKEYRKLKIGTTLVQKAIEAMLADKADEVVLETEMSNLPALRLYENLGFVRDKRLFRYYLNGVDALRLKLWFR